MKDIIESPSKKLLTVIHSIDCWLPQTATWLYNQIRFLPDMVQNHIVCYRTENLNQFTLPNIHEFKNSLISKKIWDKTLRVLKLRNFFWDIVPIAKRIKATLLHSHFGNIGWQNICAVKISGLKHIVTFYGFDVNFLPKQDPVWLERYHNLFKTVDVVLCEGNHMASCISRLGCPEQKIKVHHLGICTHEIDFRPRAWAPGETLRVLIAATFREKKGIPYALEALAKIKKLFPIEITIIGSKTKEVRSEREFTQIHRKASEHELYGSIRFLGFQNHVTLFKEAYNHHIFLSPSITGTDGDTEGGAPVSIIEMAATGMPIVSSFHCDIPEVILHNETGLLSEERDVDGIASNIQWLVENPESWREMLTKGRKHIEKFYDARVQGHELLKIYNSLFH